MNLLQKITLSLSLYIILGSVAFAQAVDIPDRNLRQAVRDAMDGAPITQTTMQGLTELYADDIGIIDLTGLESAVNLVVLSIFSNPIADLTPIANLQKLEHLAIAACSLSDIHAVSRLTSLISLNARYNSIVEIAPLANLTNLVKLRLNGNQITDVRPLANLSRLEFLEIQHNQITNHSPLADLPLIHFVYDQTCEMPSRAVRPRLVNRSYPSVMARWNRAPINNRPELTSQENLARHDLRFNTKPFGLRFLRGPDGFKMAGDLSEAIETHADLHALNPNMIHLVDLGMRAAPLDWFSEDSAVWIRDNNDNIFIEVWRGEPVSHGLLDFTSVVVQDMIVEQAVAVSKCGLYDGIFFDYWSEEWRVLGGFDGTHDQFFRTMEEEQRARDIILQRIRAATRPNFLIMGNTNRTIIPRTAPYINGSFMETGVPDDKTDRRLERDLREAEESLLWLDNNTREPRINSLEGDTVPSEAPDSSTNLRWMRALTTLSLTHSNGYVLFNDSTASGHYWYDFWDADLGRPVGRKAQLYQDIDGLYIREFTNGWAVYNHSGSPQVITLPEEVQGVASGLINVEHALPDLDGEMYLQVKPANPADVNSDGVVNVFDLTLVAQAISMGDGEGDVNEDGVVNVFDLVFVANQF